MTIRIWNAPRGGECFCPVFNHVKTVTATRIIFNDGSELYKGLMPKVEVLGDDDYEEDGRLYRRVGRGTIEEWRELPFPTEL